MCFVEIWLYLGRLFNPKQNIGMMIRRRILLHPLMFCLICNAMVLLSLTSVRAADSSPDGTTVDRITFREENRFDPVIRIFGRCDVPDNFSGSCLVRSGHLRGRGRGEGRDAGPESRFCFIGAYFVSRGYFVCHLAVRS